MPWTIPPTWAPGTKDQPTITDFNQLLRDNLNFLLGGRDIQFKDYLGVDKTTTSATFAAVDTANFRLTSGTIYSGRYLVVAQAEWAVTTLNNKIFGDIWVDGTTRPANGDATNGLGSWNNPNQNSDRMLLIGLFTGLSVAAHNFDIAWRVSAGTGTIFTSVAALHMIGMEV